jgi:hypothetical protein
VLLLLLKLSHSTKTYQISTTTGQEKEKLQQGLGKYMAEAQRQKHQRDVPGHNTPLAMESHLRILLKKRFVI